MRCSLISFILLFVAFVTLGQAQTTTSIPGCGFAGLDFSALGARDLYYWDSVGQWEYVLRMCGSVVDSICLSDQTSVAAMVCQRNNLTDSGTQAYNLMRWRNNGADGTWGAEDGGLFYQYAGGELCAATGGIRTTTVHLMCMANATTPSIYYVTEASTCQYHLYVNTNLACATNPTCGFLGADLSPVFGNGGTTDLSIVSGGYTWYVNLCGPVVFAGCRNDSTAENSMVCQHGSSDAYSVADYSASAVTWSVNLVGSNAGLQATLNNGEWCAVVNANRIARIYLVCDRSLGSNGTYITGVSEVTTCVYQITILTPYSCSLLPSSTGSNSLSSSSWWPNTNVDCSFAPENNPTRVINYNSLKNGADLLYDGFVGSTYYNVSFHMCGVIRNTQCLSDATTYNSMICQASVTNPNDNWALGIFDPNNMIWGETQFGVQYYQETGEFCGDLPRSVTVEFQCVSTATHAQITSMSETQTCQYLMLIDTNLVCNGTNEKHLPENDQPIYPNCVYQIGQKKYDFKTLNPADGSDLSITVNGSTVYNIYLHMCAVVSNFRCRSDVTAQHAMVCQQQSNVNGDSYSLGDYVESNMIWGEVPGQQVIRLKMINGEYCGGNLYRTVSIDFVCNLAYSRPTIISYTEAEVCTYQMQVAANDLLCSMDPSNPDGHDGDGNPSSGNGSSSSDSINNGEIALIVIVIVLGLLLIIGACVAWRYYGRPYAFQKESNPNKAVEMGESRNTYDTEESQSTV